MAPVASPVRLRSVPSYMVAGSSDASAPGTTTALATDLTLVGDATGATLYDAHLQVATLMTQLGLMPQIMDIRLTSATSSTTVPNDVQFSIAANLRPFARTPPLAPAAPSITMGGGQ